jgi:2-C-methyl-D-erythritol 4-phosphate cytidylyltransferase
MLGIAVTIVDGADEAFKITYPWDLAVAQAFVEHMKTEKN